MRISPISAFAPNLSTNNNIYHRLNTITFKAKGRHFAKETDRPSFLIKLGQKREPEVQKRAADFEDEARMVLSTGAENLKDEAKDYYERAISELFHRQGAKHIYPAGFTLLSRPVAFDVKSREEGIYVKLFQQEGDNKNQEEEFFFTHQGVLLEYEKRMSKSRSNEPEGFIQRFNFDENGNLKAYRELSDVKKNKRTVEKKFEFKDGEIESIESKSSLDSRTGKRGVKEILEFKGGELKYVYINTTFKKDGTKTYKSKYRANANGELKCVYNMLF